MLLRSLVHLARTRFASLHKSIDGLLLEVAEAMKRQRPEERFAELNRVLLDVHHQERREPRRAAVVQTALLDLILETLQWWARSDPALSGTVSKMTPAYDDWRSRIDREGIGFDEEVDVIRSGLRL